MTGRSTGMDAPRASLRGSHRVACLVAGLLCAMGVLSGAVLHSAGSSHHHSPTIAATMSLADGHGVSVRGDQHLVATAPVTVAHSLRWTRSVAVLGTSADGVTIDSIRTRGPPAPA